MPAFEPHGEVELELPGGGDAMKLLALVPLTEKGVALQLRHGLDTPMNRMDEAGSPGCSIRRASPFVAVGLRPTFL